MFLRVNYGSLSVYSRIIDEELTSSISSSPSFVKGFGRISFMPYHQGV
jgi:hypothetical protein